MNQFIFKSRWIALAFTVLTLFSAYTLVGSEDDGSVLGSVQASGTVPLAAAAAPVVPAGTVLGAETAPPTPEVMDDSEFVDDDELIDDASGTDPVPDGGDGGDDGGDVGDGSGGDTGDAPQ